MPLEDPARALPGCSRPPRSTQHRGELPSSETVVRIPGFVSFNRLVGAIATRLDPYCKTSRISLVGLKPSSS
jgi:hypothetical protein